MKRYIVTGGAGFIGSNLAKKLINEGHEVFVLDDLSTGFLRNVPAEAKFLRVDISDFKKLSEIVFDGSVAGIFHLAAQSSGEASFDNPPRDMERNYLATYNMLKLAEQINCRRFIFASSMSVYGEISSSGSGGGIGEDHPCKPVSYYGCHKLASEHLIRIFVRHTEIRTTSFRFFNVYGPGQNMNNMKQGMASIYMSYLMRDEPVIVKGSLDRFRDFIYVDDVVDVLLMSERYEQTYGEVFNVGTGKATTVRELLEAMLQAFGKEEFARWVIVEGSTPGDIMGFTADIAKLKGALDWEPGYDVGRGIAQMKGWIDRSRDYWR